jgi:hypothetical protein
LALTDPSADHIGAVTVPLSGVPAGWTLSEGTDNGDGTWTVQTNNIAALSITTPNDYAGALVLNVTETWINADGSTGRAIVIDNVEAYAQGSPIFAVSGDDNLEGGGQVVLSDSSENVISGTVSDVTLANVDNTISGAGHLGGGQMILVNEGTIIASGTFSLDIDTGTSSVINSGTLEATGSGGLVIHNDVVNTGVLWANGGNVTVDGNVSGNGSAMISGSATLEFAAASAENVTFASGSTGTLALDHAFDFSGIVSGMAPGNHLDLFDFNYANTTLNYTANADGTGGTLSVTDGAHTANIALLGQYDPAGFQAEADKATGTLISYHLLA